MLDLMLLWGLSPGPWLIGPDTERWLWGTNPPPLYRPEVLAAWAQAIAGAATVAAALWIATNQARDQEARLRRDRTETLTVAAGYATLAVQVMNEVWVHLYEADIRRPFKVPDYSVVAKLDRVASALDMFTPQTLPDAAKLMALHKLAAETIIFADLIRDMAGKVDNYQFARLWMLLRGLDEVQDRARSQADIVRGSAMEPLERPATPRQHADFPQDEGPQTASEPG